MRDTISRYDARAARIARARIAKAAWTAGARNTTARRAGTEDHDDALYDRYEDARTKKSTRLECFRDTMQ